MLIVELMGTHILIHFVADTSCHVPIFPQICRILWKLLTTGPKHDSDTNLHLIKIDVAQSWVIQGISKRFKCFSKLPHILSLNFPKLVKNMFFVEISAFFDGKHTFHGVNPTTATHHFLDAGDRSGTSSRKRCVTPIWAEHMGDFSRVNLACLFRNSMIWLKHGEMSDVFVFPVSCWKRIANLSCCVIFALA